MENVLRGFMVVMGTLIAGVVALALLYFHSMEPEPQPDVAKAARSATAEAADQAVTAQVDNRIGQMRAALPWAAYLGTTVADVCSTDWAPSAIGARQTWTPVTCTRTDTVYEAFDGDFKQRLAQLDGILGASGWRFQDFETVHRQGEQPGLVAVLDHVHEPPGDPDPSQVAEAAARPNMVRAGYIVPITPDFTPAEHSARPVPASNGTVEVTQAPHLPSLDDGTARHDIALKYPSVKTSYYRDWQPYSPAQAAAAYPAHGAVLAISLSVSYGTASAKP